MTDDTYQALSARKRPGESFSDVIASLLDRGRPLLRDVVGLAGDDAHWEHFADERRAARHRTSGRVDLD